MGEESPKPERESIPFWKVLGTERHLREGKKEAWVIFSDVIARIRLEGPWTISRRGPRPLEELSPLVGGDPMEIYVQSRDGVLCLMGGFLPHELQCCMHVSSELVVAEHVMSADDPEHEHCYLDIVRVRR